MDDFDISIQSINEMFAARNMPLFKDKEDYLKHFCFPIENYYRNVGFDFEKEPYAVLAHEFIEKYNSKMPSCGLVKGVKEAMETFKNNGLEQMILSACEQQMLERDVCRFGLDKYFSAVLGGGDIYAKGKVERALEWISDSKTDISDTLFVGDTLHDYETARALGVDAVLVTYGHSNRRILSEAAAFVVDSPEEVVKIALK